MTDMHATVIPKSDQLNFDDLSTGQTKTIKITKVSGKSGDQPIAISYENDNGKLDENGWGVPIEGYGFSNNAEGFLGPASFKDAAVMLDQADKTIEIRVNYRIPAADWLRTAPGEDAVEGSSASPDTSQMTPP